MMNKSNSHNAPHAEPGFHPLFPPSGQQPVNLPLPDDKAPIEKPFRVELFRTDERGGKFTPSSRLIVTKALRTSGLLRDLPDAEAKTLLLLITFLRSDGRCEVSVPEAAAALNIAPAKARLRLDRLADVLLGSQPVIHLLRRDSGLDGYVLSAALVEEQQISRETEKLEEVATLPARRADMIAHSRSHYANPRADVEAIILTQQLGHTPVVPLPPPNLSTPEGAARQAMVEIGVPHEQIDLLLTSFPVETITQQIQWLPHRHPKDPAKLLVSAIRHNYEPPAFIRLQQALGAEDANEEKELAPAPPERKSSK